MHPNGAKLQSVEHPRAQPFRVALNWVRLCPTDITSTPEPEPEDMPADTSGEGVCAEEDICIEEPDETAEETNTLYGETD